MLPDFTETKKLFVRFFQTYVRQKARAISPFADVKTRHIHEGRVLKVIHADQSESISESKQFSSEILIKLNDIPDLTLEKTIAKYDDMILDMVRKQTGFALQRLDEEIPASQYIGAKGKRLDAELVLEMLETMQLEFYSDGRLHELHVVGELLDPERLKAVDEQFQNNPDLQNRYDELIDRKKEEWRAREASRKLVG